MTREIFTEFVQGWRRRVYVEDQVQRTDFIVVRGLTRRGKREREVR